MSRLSSYRTRAVVLGATLALGAGLGLNGSAPAAADTAPTDPGLPTTVSADALPTAQIDGVAWSQAVVGNTVYVGGKFTNVRPAGSAAGVNTVTRNNAMAYDIRTGANVASFAPDLNGQVLAVAASPDGSRIYVGGDFTVANGQSRSRIAAYSTATGQLVSSFKPAASTKVSSIVATNSTVYFGGNFQAVSGVARRYVAAADAATGAVTAWNPSADAAVTALTLNASRSKVIIGGRFQNLGTTQALGLGAVDPTTGSAVRWDSSNQIRSYGSGAAITSLASDEDGVYGTAYNFYGTGNLEGSFRADGETGAVIWIEDCLGDTYSIMPSKDAVYTASHKHFCGNIDGFPETNPRSHHHGQAFTKKVTGTIKTVGGFPDWNGFPRPTYTVWDPTFGIGKVTGQNQAGWTVTASSSGDYVAYAGEFPSVNGTAQAGLVRFAKPGIAPNKRGPNGNDGLTPSVVAPDSSRVRIAWQSTFDQDNENLTYKVYRNFKSTSDTPVCSFTSKSSFWQRPRIGCFDTTVTPGTRYNYRVYVNDAFGNSTSRAATFVDVPTASQQSAYATAVSADDPSGYYRLGEPSGTTVVDSVAFNDGTAEPGVSRGAGGAVGDADTASSFNGSADGFAVTSDAVAGPNTFGVEGWFRTTSTSGGKIVGFGNSKTGISGSYDRHVYMDNDGRVWFGVYPNQVRTVNSSAGYNDGQWHQFVATMGTNGMTLFLDGRRVASRGDTTTGQDYTGQWRIGGDNIGGWPNQPASNFLAGDIDEVAIYDKTLTRTDVVDHYQASGRTLPGSTAPSDAYGAAVYAQEPDLYWRLDEASGEVASDSGPAQNAGRIITGVSLGRDGALNGQTRTAGGFNGSDGHVVATSPTNNPTTYSESVWFKTSTNRGGKLIGFGSAPSYNSGGYDRHVYMDDGGRLIFGTWTGFTNTITSPTSLNDGSWHNVVATQSGDGMKLYVDGELVGTNEQTGAQDYEGYWRIGGDNTWGSSSAYFDGTLDEAAVFSTALPSATIKQLYQLGSGSTPNAAPKAVFSSSVDGLKASFDSSGSSDDGTIASRSWDFGDGTTGSGVSPERTYAAAGTYTVRLTVTDDKGLTDTATREVTVQKANQKPTAAFSSTTDGLKASFDSSGSSDDGTIASRSWDFGDGTTGSGVSPERTYAAAGTYTVRLTVTDDKGLTDSTIREVTVSAPPTVTSLATDGFSRVLASGWGSADRGGAWTLVGAASRFEVGGGTGLMKVPAGSTPGAYLTGVTSRDTDTTVDVSLDQAVTGGGVYATVIGRGTPANGYRARLKIVASGAMTLSAMKSEAGAETALRNVVLPGSFATGDKMRIRLQVVGSGPTTVRAKAWKAGTSEPTAWQASVTDTTSALQSASGVGLLSYLSASATNGPLTFRYDDYAVVVPE